MKNLPFIALMTNVALVATCAAGELKFETPMPFASAIEAYAKEYSDAERTLNLARLTLSQPPLIRDSLISNDFHLSFARLDRKPKTFSGWVGQQWVASASGEHESLVIYDQHGAVKAISAGGDFIATDSKPYRFKQRSTRGDWTFLFGHHATNPIQEKQELSEAVWASVSAGGMRYKIDLANWLKSFNVNSIHASDEPPVLECRTDADEYLEIRFHNPVGLLRFSTPLRCVRRVSSDGNIIRRLIADACPSKPRYKAIDEDVFSKWNPANANSAEAYESLIQFSDGIHCNRIGKQAPPVKEVLATAQAMIITDSTDIRNNDNSDAELDPEWSVHLVHFMAATASEVHGPIRFSVLNVGEHGEATVRKNYVHNYDGIAKMARRGIVREYGKIPVDEPLASLAFSTVCSPIVLTTIEQYACSILESDELNRRDYFALLEGVANWGEPSFYDAECLLPKTLQNSLSGGIMKARWGRRLSDDEIAALTLASGTDGHALLPAVESLIAAGRINSVPENFVGDWYRERVIDADENDRAFALHRLTNTKAGRRYCQQHAKSLSDDKDLHQLVDDILDTREQAAQVERRLLRGADIDTPDDEWKLLLKRFLK